MSKGPGKVQRAIIAAFEQEPSRRLTAAELAASIFADQPTASHIETVRQALSKLGFKKSRCGHLKTGGWRYVWGV
jgi:Fe2+ or Zn2+ uptake regulation protein